jgi:UDP-N-acetyl-D-glucosamine dehydrogenase
MKSVDLTPETLGAQDAILVLTNHKVYDYTFVGKHSSLVLDTRNAMKNVAHRDNIVKI